MHIVVEKKFLSIVLSVVFPLVLLFDSGIRSHLVLDALKDIGRGSGGQDHRPHHVGRHLS